MQPTYSDLGNHLRSRQSVNDEALMQAAAFPTPPEEAPILVSPDQFMAAITHCWSQETCAPALRMTWSDANPAQGHALITCLLAQKYVPAKGRWQLVPVLVGEVNDGAPEHDAPNLHVYLRDSADGFVFDPTASQFLPGTPLQPAGEKVQVENTYKEEAMERLAILENRFLAQMRSTAQTRGALKPRKPDIARKAQAQAVPLNPLSAALLPLELMEAAQQADTLPPPVAGSVSPSPSQSPPVQPPVEAPPISTPTEIPPVSVPDEITPPHPQ